MTLRGYGPMSRTPEKHEKTRKEEKRKLLVVVYWIATLAFSCPLWVNSSLLLWRSENGLADRALATVCVLMHCW